MCIKKVEAFSFDGKTYPTEGAAIAAAVGKVLDNTGIAQKVIDNSSALLPYLQRVIAIEAERRQPETPNEADPEKPNHPILPPIPDQIYWSSEHGNFYQHYNNAGLGQEFFNTWYERRAEFPQERAL